ncbi:hypothetical protein CCS41_13345 [Candidatus Fukatsuia symbiotica]|uniref:Uncharacterized protein n=1 Tax=Candidatus Fukatsuia symbiotica TaxID=1878942 RepID=A0A2U8IAJ6_9GAMM|nr:hypothetical protein CCS41_13345 [Candidatus Fukatsuia symbiotica]
MPPKNPVVQNPVYLITKRKQFTRAIKRYHVLIILLYTDNLSYREKWDRFKKFSVKKQKYTIKKSRAGFIHHYQEVKKNNSLPAKCSKRRIF